MSEPAVAPGRRLDPGLLRSHLGEVVAFDVAVGVGEVRDGTDGSRYAFHCSAIADGSRRIEVGRAVAFLVVPGHLGELEGSDLVPVPAAG